VKRGNVVPFLFATSLLVACFVVCGPFAQSIAVAANIESSNPLSGDLDAISEGKTIYRAHCGLCHGMNANGRGHGPGNTSDLTKFKKGYSWYMKRVKNGRVDKGMPSWGGILKEEEITKIGAYLETLAGKRAKWVDPPQN
jgi:mono/diheme cytochrome c family protein